MSLDFSLARDRWIPVVDHDTGAYTEVGVGDALTQAHALSLAVTGHEHAVVLRLLLAAFDAAAGPVDYHEWGQCWRAAALDADRIAAYLDRTADRWALYHPHRPVFQAAGLSACPRPASVLHHAYLSAAGGQMFHLETMTRDAPISAAEAARALLLRHAYDVAGIKGGIGGGQTYGSWRGHLGPVTHTSIRGRTLKDELLLNLPPRPRTEGDRPLWEADEDLPLTPGATRPVSGRLTWWTWPSRLVRLHPDSDGNVVALAWHDGFRPPARDAARTHDPLTAWHPDTGEVLTPGDEFGDLPPWFAGRLDPDHGALAHLRAAATEADLGNRIRLTVTWAQYNRHNSVIEDEPTGTALLGPAALVAEPDAWARMAAAAHFAGRIPAAIRHTVHRNDILTSDGPLVLQNLHGAWQQLLHDLAAGTDDGAVMTWRDAVTNAADAVIEQMNFRSVQDRIRTESYLHAYLDGVPVNAVSDTPARTRAHSVTRRGREVYTAHGEQKTLTQWAADPRCAVSAPTLRKRITAGETLEEAMIGKRRAKQPSRCAADPASCGTPNGWRHGGRCPNCLRAHLSDLRNYRKTAALRRAATARDIVLDRLGTRHDLTAAAHAAGMTVQQVHTLARHDPDWSAQLDAALMASRSPELDHGTERAYRHGRCRCPDCRTAHRDREKAAGRR